MRASSLFTSLVLVIMVANAKGERGGGGEEHVVGGDQGWDAASDVSSWAIGRSFRVGDNIWFTYSAAEGGIAELRSREEYESCDITNPIRLYTVGLDKVRLDRQGPRYFVGSATGSCSKGLKLHVHVEPEGEAGRQGLTTVQAADDVADAEGPMPSGSIRIRSAFAPVAMWLGLAAVCLVGLVQCVQ